MWLDSVSERARALREMAGIRQREASRLAGLKSPSHYGMIENGEGGIAAATAHCLCSLYGVHLDLLLYGSGRVPSALSVKRAVAKAKREHEQPPANPGE